MKVLVLGANGQLGSDLVRVHKERGANFDLLPLTRTDLDVTDLESIPKFLADLDFQALVNCTSYHRTDEAESNATLAFTVNAHAVAALAESCRVKKARLVHISTDYVFSGNDEKPYTETDRPSPVNVYGASKAMGEVLAMRGNPDTLVLRVASLFGIAGASGKGGNFVETMLKFGREKGELRVVNDVAMSPTSTRDVADMILSLLSGGADAGIYHAVNSGQATWYRFAKDIIGLAGVKAKVIPVTSAEFPTKAIRPANSVLDNGKIATVCGEISHWREALRHYLVEKEHISAPSAK